MHNNNIQHTTIIKININIYNYKNIRLKIINIIYIVYITKLNKDYIEIMWIKDDFFLNYFLH